MCSFSFKDFIKSCNFVPETAQTWKRITVVCSVSRNTILEMIKGQSNTAPSAPSAQVGNNIIFGFLLNKEEQFSSENQITVCACSHFRSHFAG